jgi:hypothetical protein
MDVLGSAVGALDAHRGVAEVAENGLRLLANVACASENKVGATRGFCGDRTRVIGGFCCVPQAGGDRMRCALFVSGCAWCAGAADGRAG